LPDLFFLKRWLGFRKNKIILMTILDKGPGTKSSGINLKQIDPWIGPFFILKKTFLKKGTMSASKRLGVQYQKCDWNVRGLSFSFFFLFSWFFLFSGFTSISCTWKDWECSFFSSNHPERMQKINHVNSRID